MSNIKGEKNTMKELGQMKINGEEYVVIPKKDYTNISNLLTDLVKKEKAIPNDKNFNVLKNFLEDFVKFNKDEIFLMKAMIEELDKEYIDTFPTILDNTYWHYNCYTILAKYKQNIYKNLIKKGYVEYKQNGDFSILKEGKNTKLLKEILNSN